MEISCLAKEPFDWGKFWNSFSVTEQSAFLLGIELGILKGIADSIEHYVFCFSSPLKEELILYAIMAKIGPEEMAKIFACLIVKENGVLREREESLVYLMGTDILHKHLNLSELFDLEVISKVVTDLYKDLANTYISIVDMYILAIRKLKGESIESSLRELREEALR